MKNSRPKQLIERSRLSVFFRGLALSCIALAAMAVPAQAQLSGSYTVCSSGCDYSSIGAAVSALQSQGVSGATVFNISSGTYSENVSVPSITGASATNTISFKGAGRGNTVLANASGGQTLYFNAAKYVSFSGLTITATSTYAVYSYLSVNCSVADADINAPAGSSGSYGIYDYYTSNWKVSDCHISGGYYGIYIYSSANSSTYANNSYLNNRIVNFGYYGVYGLYSNAMTFSGNVIDSSYYGYGYGIYTLYESGPAYSANQIVAPGLYYPCLFYYINYFSSAKQASIINNFFSNYQYYLYLYLYSSSNVLIAHNTLYDNAGGYYALYMYASGGSNISLISNIIINNSSSSPAGYINFVSSNSIIDGNDWVNNGGGPLVSTQNGTYSTLAAYQSSMAGYSYTSLYDASTQKFESHATNEMPTFVNPPKNLRLDYSGNVPTCVYAGVNTDIDGNTRNAAAPVAGAYEKSCTVPAFTSCPGNITTGTSTTSCNAAVTYTSAATNSPTYSYSFSGATTGSGSGTGSGSAFNKGTTNVTVTATNACGTATCSFTITVNDNVPPVAIAQNITLDLSGGHGSITAAQVDNGSYDNCGAVSLSLDKTNFTCADAGNNTVTLTVTDGSGNTSTATATVTVNAAASASITAGGSTTFCSGGSVVLTASSGASYQWSNENGPILGQTGQTLTVTNSGTYYVTVTNAYGCSATSSGVTVTVNPTPTVTASASPTTVYYGYTAAYNTSTLSASSSVSGVTYSWTSSPSGFTSTDQNPTVTPSATTTYTVTATTASGCSSSASVTVTVIDVRCGNKNDKVLICHSCNSLCISANAVAAHLANHPGDHLGDCGPCGAAPQPEADMFKVYPNPFSASTSVLLSFEKDQQVNIALWSIDGRLIKTLYNGDVTANSPYTYTIDGTNMAPGMYMVKVTGAEGMQYLKIELIKP